MFLASLARHQGAWLYKNNHPQYVGGYSTYWTFIPPSLFWSIN